VIPFTVISELTALLRVREDRCGEDDSSAGTALMQGDAMDPGRLSPRNNVLHTKFSNRRRLPTSTVAWNRLQGLLRRPRWRVMSFSQELEVRKWWFDDRVVRCFSDEPNEAAGRSQEGASSPCAPAATVVAVESFTGDRAITCVALSIAAECKSMMQVEEGGGVEVAVCTRDAALGRRCRELGLVTMTSLGAVL
jgi:hypothetical protein